MPAPNGRGISTGQALFKFTASAGGADVVESDGASTEENKAKGHGGQAEREFITSGTGHTVVQVNFQDGNGQIDADAEGGDASEQTDQQEQSAEEFGVGGKIGAPGGKAEAGDHFDVVVESPENFVVAVNQHDGA